MALVTWTAVRALFYWWFLAGITAAVAASHAKVERAGLSSDVYTAFALILRYIPDNEHDLASLSETCVDLHLHLRQRLIRCRFSRLLDPDSDHNPHLYRCRRFLNDLRNLVRDHQPGPRQIDSPEVQQFRQYGTASNQVVLAHNLCNVLMVKPADPVIQTVGDVVLFLRARYGYDALPGYLLGFCIRHQLTQSVRMLSPRVAPLLSPRPDTLPAPIRDLVQHVSSLSHSSAVSKLKDVVPDHLRPYLAEYHLLYYELCQPTNLEHIRGRPDVIQFLFQIGFAFDLQDLVTWAGMTPAECRLLAPFLTGIGFCQFMARAMARGQYDLVAELFRHRMMVRELARLRYADLFLACQVAIRFRAGAVLRGLLGIPSAAERLRRSVKSAEQFAVKDWMYSDQCLSPLLRLLQSSYRPGLDPYPDHIGTGPVLVLDMKALLKALDMTLTAQSEYFDGF